MKVLTLRPTKKKGKRKELLEITYFKVRKTRNMG